MSKNKRATNIALLFYPNAFGTETGTPHPDRRETPASGPKTDSIFTKPPGSERLPRGSGFAGSAMLQC